jgi:hypothetical protein
MSSAVSTYKHELLDEIESLSEENIRELLDFTYFLKARNVIEPSQAYFWTNVWQAMEREADQDKAAGKIIGDGTVQDLLQELKRRVKEDCCA